MPIIEREDVRVMFRRTRDEQEAITRTWADVEAVVGSLRKRKFYGVNGKRATTPRRSDWRMERSRVAGTRASDCGESRPPSTG